MKTKFLLLLTSTIFGTANATVISDYACSRADFSHQQLSEAYVSSEKLLETYSEARSRQIVQLISSEVNVVPNSFNKPCASDSSACFGHDDAWSFEQNKIRDSFRNFLRMDGKITSQNSKTWPASEKYYEHQTRTTYTCSWGGNLPAQCEKSCVLLVTDDRFHD